MAVANRDSAAAAGRDVPFGLTSRIFVGIALIVSTVLAVVLILASLSARRAVDATMRRGLEQSADLAAQFLAGRERSLAGGAKVFVQGPYFRALVAGRRRDDILDQTFEAAEQLGADWVFITDERGFLLAKSDEPAALGDAMGSVPLIAGALQGRVTTGFGISRDSLLFQAVAVPIVVPGAAPVGVLVATKIVDSTLARDISSASNGDIVFYAFDTHGIPRIAASTLPKSVDIKRLLPAQRNGTRAVIPSASIGGESYALQGNSVTTSGGDVVGGFIVLRSRDAERTGITAIRRSLLIASLVGLLLALGASYLAARRIARPLRAFANAARRAAEGDYSVENAGGAGLDAFERSDEIGVLGSAFSELLTDLRDRKSLVELLGAPRGQRTEEPVKPPSETPALSIVRGGSAARGPVVAAIAPEHDVEPRKELRRAAGEEVAPLLAARFELRELIGAGGNGLVYRAVDRSLNSVIAIKILRLEALEADAGALERLKEEIRLARQVTHRNVVRTHDLGVSGETHFITMEFVDGPSLADIIAAHGPLPKDAVLSIARQLFRALSVAHGQGVIHGDLKPQNVLLNADGVVKVADFGLARLATHRGAPPDIAGAQVGTPEYMAPEQLIGEAANERTDIYAAGVLLSECMTGISPRQADTPLKFISSRLRVPDESRRAEPIRMRSDANSLESLIAEMSSHDPARRPASAEIVSELLQRIAIG
jgi:serine/threonine-protein kinase